MDWIKNGYYVHDGWNWLTNFQDDSGMYRGAVGFSRLYYEKKEGYLNNALFFFGTAYQFLF